MSSLIGSRTQPDSDCDLIARDADRYRVGRIRREHGNLQRGAFFPKGVQGCAWHNWLRVESKGRGD
ncbi:hypothetical protein [Methylobacterium sp. WL6]|uniref:hypothetical protein n=1 Tax=Methylobacterium sp. WL6 TaxID=2603901 RepID=UPI0011CA4962|nr:hypothetical protein [Methylobacterium sp. WL6]TXN72095.1 hypothetical protein FV230_06145 [Methylobacterium sp. WL6]